MLVCGVGALVTLNLGCAEVHPPPCDPTTAPNVPAGDAWLHEPKLDGYRMQIVKEGQHGAARQPPRQRVDELARHSPCRSAIIDAELCLPGAGAPTS
jgi:ATP-dependent DNA ligase